MRAWVPQSGSGRLPAELNSFVGRRREVADVRQLVTTQRLVSLVGPGGVGKSRIAQQVSASLERRFADGVWWVDLSNVDDGTLLADEIVSAVGITKAQGRNQLEVLVSALESRDSLLVLDTCEHVLNACADVIVPLLSRTDKLHILMTTREALRSAGEHVYEIAPLRVGANGHDRSEDIHVAVQLFADRAASVSAGFEVTEENRPTIGRICALLDGLPLSIELSALQLPMFTVEDLLTRIERHGDIIGTATRSAPHRQSSLQATLDWSFDLCTPNEQSMWIRSSVFAGGFDLSAAEVVCSDDALDSRDLFEALAGLRAKSVLVADRAEHTRRFRQLDSVRSYAQLRVASRDSFNAARYAHADWVFELVADASAHWFSHEQQRWLRRCNAERGNIRAAIETLLTSPEDRGDGTDRERALELVNNLWFYWMSAGHVDEGMFWIERSLAACQGTSAVLGRGLWTQGLLATCRGQLARAKELAYDSLDEATRAGDQPGEANAWFLMGLLEYAGGQLKEATTHFRDATASFQALGLYDMHAAIAKTYLGQALAYQGDLDAAERVLIECEQASEAAGERWAWGYVQVGLAVVSFKAGEPRTALDQIQSALHAGDEMNDVRAILLRLDVLTWISAAAGEKERAAVLLGAVGTIWPQERSPSYYAHQMKTPRELATESARERIGEKAFAAAFERGSKMTLEEVLDYALGRMQAAPPPPARHSNTLTDREQEIAEFVATGMANKDIANKLVLSPRTVENHVQKILTKLGFQSRTQIAVWMLGDPPTPR